MKKKLLYEVPEAEQFFVKIERNFMNSPLTGKSNVEIPDEEESDIDL